MREKWSISYLEKEKKKICEVYEFLKKKKNPVLNNDLNEFYVKESEFFCKEFFEK